MADMLMWKRSLRDVESAAAIYEEVLQQSPDDLDLQLKLADCLNTIMRIRTHSNTLIIDGLLDTAENKKVWSMYGEKALAFAEKVKEMRPKDVKAVAVHADAYLFSTSTKGIISAAIAGAASRFKANAELIIRLDKKYDSGVGYALMGAFYCVAPWPVGSIAKAEEFMDKALSIGGRTRRNHYYVGVIAYKRQLWTKAEENFQAAITTKPGSVTEADFADFMVYESKRALSLIAKHQKQKQSTKDL